MYKVIVSETAAKSIEELPSDIKQNIKSAIDYLERDNSVTDVDGRDPANNLWTISINSDYSLDFKIGANKIEIVKIHGKSDREKEQTNSLVISYMFLRKLIGVCGMLLPFALAVNPDRPGDYYGFEPSISDYYYTSRGDFLVVLLSILGIFLFTYRGYNFIERLLTRIAGFCAFGVAFVPTKAKCKDCLFSVHTESGGVFGNMHGEGAHLTFAAIFLICLGYISLKYFPQTNASSLKKHDNTLTQKGKRNKVYIICGWIMMACVGVLGVYFLLQPDLKNFPIIFVMETVAVIAFGLSWLTKGQALWPDQSSNQIS